MALSAVLCSDTIKSIKRAMRRAGEHPNDLIRARARMLTLPVQQSVGGLLPLSLMLSLCLGWLASGECRKS